MTIETVVLIFLYAVVFGLHSVAVFAALTDRDPPAMSARARNSDAAAKFFCYYGYVLTLIIGVIGAWHLRSSF